MLMPLKKCILFYFIRKWCLIFLIFSAVNLCCFLHLFQNSMVATKIEDFGTEIQNSVKAKQPKIILTWTKWFNYDFAEVYPLSKCPELECKISSNQSYLPEADAVVFHIRDSQRELLPKGANQRFVFFVLESPVHTNFDLQCYPPHYFNWTMTYRRDSDLVIPYGTLTRNHSCLLQTSANCVSVRDPGWGIVRSQLKAVNSQNLGQVLDKKTKFGVWPVSNCRTDSKREQLMQVLAQPPLNVEIWGTCRDANACPTSKNADCFSRIDQNYKFYFALENSVCKDYVTEKFWNIYGLNVVPVVLKRSILTPFVPAKSFIAVDDFKTVQIFVAYLQYLDRNRTAYAEYLIAKNNHAHVFAHPENKYEGMCMLCQKLLNSDKNPSKSYENIHRWWSIEADCQNNFVSHFTPNNSDKNR